jgi:F-type H+-transporting ATPase subunit b
MLIDWFTVGAQAINFLILVWLLKRFLYRPVLAAIDAREKKVAAKLIDATAREAQAQLERDDLQRRNEAFDREREGLLRKAIDAAALERQRLIESARQDSEQLRSRLTETLTNERAELSRRVLMWTQAEVLDLARRTLTDLAGAGLEERMTEVFVAHLRDLPEDQKIRLAGGPRAAQWQTTATHAALVRSAFEIPSSQRSVIEAALRETLATDVTVRFETSSDLVCGIELRVDGVKLAWSVSDHLSAISASAADLVASVSAAAMSAQAAESASAPVSSVAEAPTLKAQHEH